MSVAPAFASSFHLLRLQLQRVRLVTLDPKALTYILNHTHDFPKPQELREDLAELLGQGRRFIIEYT